MTASGRPDLQVPVGPDVLAEVFDGEAVVVHLGTGIYYSFDRAATDLWVSLCNSNTADGLDAQALDFLAFLVREHLAVGPEQGSTTGDAGGDNGEWPGISRFTDMADLLLLDPIHDIDLDGSGWPTVDGERAAS